MTTSPDLKIMQSIALIVLDYTPEQAEEVTFCADLNPEMDVASFNCHFSDKDGRIEDFIIENGNQGYKVAMLLIEHKKYS